MDINQFYYYIAIAEECNLSKAAEKLYVSQSSLSRFLIKLEASLCVSLFARTKNKSLIITEAGTKLLESCRKIVSEYESFLNEVSPNGYNQENKIVFGTTGEAGTRYISEIFSAFRKSHPNITFELVTRPVKELEDMLMHNQIDIMRVAYYRKVPEFEYTALKSVPVDLIVPLEHPLAKRGDHVPGDTANVVSLDELRNEPLVLLKDDTVLGKISHTYFEANNFKPKKAIEVVSSLSALSMVGSGAAIGLLPRSYSSSKVRFLNLENPLEYKIAVIYKKGVHLSHAHHELIRLCNDDLLKNKGGKLYTVF